MNYIHSLFGKATPTPSKVLFSAERSLSFNSLSSNNSFSSMPCTDAEKGLSMTYPSSSLLSSTINVSPYSTTPDVGKDTCIISLSTPSLLPSEVNTDPTKSDNMDVFFASGNFSKSRKGNLALTKICLEFQNEYDKALKRQQKSDSTTVSVYKATVLKKILTKFQTEYPTSKIWSRKNEGGDWIEITNNTPLIISKLQWKLCRKKCDNPYEVHENEREPSNEVSAEESEKVESAKLNRYANRKRKQDGSDGNESVILSLSRVIAELQRDRDLQQQKIDSLQKEIASLKSVKVLGSVSKVEVSNNIYSHIEETTRVDLNASEKFSGVDNSSRHMNEDNCVMISSRDNSSAGSFNDTIDGAKSDEGDETLMSDSYDGQ